MTAEEYSYEGSVDELQKLHEEEIQENQAPAIQEKKMPRRPRHFPLVSGLARKKEGQPSWQASAIGSYNVKPTFLWAGQGQSRHWPLPCPAFPVRRSVAASAR